jgi:hypothetical protein
MKSEYPFLLREIRDIQFFELRTLPMVKQLTLDLAPCAIRRQNIPQSECTARNQKLAERIRFESMLHRKGSLYTAIVFTAAGALRIYT